MANWVQRTEPMQSPTEGNAQIEIVEKKMRKDYTVRINSPLFAHFKGEFRNLVTVPPEMAVRVGLGESGSLPRSDTSKGCFLQLGHSGDEAPVKILPDPGKDFLLSVVERAFDRVHAAMGNLCTFFEKGAAIDFHDCEVF